MHMHKLTIARARASALTQAHDARVYPHDWARQLGAWRSSKQCLADSYMRFICKPLRTPEMEEMVNKAKVLVMEQLSNIAIFLPLKSMLLLVSPSGRDIGASHCAGIDPNRNVHNLYFPQIQEIPF